MPTDGTISVLFRNPSPEVRDLYVGLRMLIYLGYIQLLYLSNLLASKSVKVMLEVYRSHSIIYLHISKAWERTRKWEGESFESGLENEGKHCKWTGKCREQASGEDRKVYNEMFEA
jgi:hypothetical protein